MERRFEMKKINWGILGLGWIGGDFSQALVDAGICK